MTHGAPLHLGDPALIGIRDLARPDYGDPVPLAADEIPLFWACGVTPQAVLAEVQPELYISHAPGTCWSATDSTTSSEGRRPSPDRDDRQVAQGIRLQAVALAARRFDEPPEGVEGEVAHRFGATEDVFEVAPMRIALQGFRSDVEEYRLAVDAVAELEAEALRPAPAHRSAWTRSAPP